MLHVIILADMGTSILTNVQGIVERLAEYDAARRMLARQFLDYPGSEWLDRHCYTAAFVVEVEGNDVKDESSES